MPIEGSSSRQRRCHPSRNPARLPGSSIEWHLVASSCPPLTRHAVVEAHQCTKMTFDTTCTATTYYLSLHASLCFHWPLVEHQYGSNVRVKGSCISSPADGEETLCPRLSIVHSIVRMIVHARAVACSHCSHHNLEAQTHDLLFRHPPPSGLPGQASAALIRAHRESQVSSFGHRNQPQMANAPS